MIGRLIRLGLIKNIDFLIKNEWIYFDEKKFQSNSDLLEIKRSLLCTIKLWRFRSRTKIKEYRKQIKKVFTPHNAILDVGRGVIAGVNADIVIGVHIRWGDYKTEAPSYYHDIEVYRARMLEAQEVFRGKKLGFVVCTEEGQDVDRLTGLLCVFPKGDAITDLYTLAQCDYLIASASTFSGWAAYWGEIAAFVVDSPDKKIETIGDFEFNDLIVNH